ncbi:MAG: hypothetical protein JW785_06970 [Acidimicrobiia bacterium]|nr:hypothetical protein [Acidimicrobiia bacterium]
MSDLHARERHDSEWGRPVADLIEDDEVVGMAYEDEGQLLVEFYPDADGESRLYDVADLQRVLDTIGAMLGIEPDSAGIGAAAATEEAEHPVDVLAAEFDQRAARRGPEDEGFYPQDAAAGIVQRCGELGLAVVAMQGFSLHRDGEDAVAGCSADLGAVYRGEPWAAFAAGCNLQAMSLLERWPRRPNFAVTLEAQDAAGEVFVL